METFLGFLKEVLKGIVRAIRAYLFQKHSLTTRKPPDAVTSKRVVLVKINFL